MKKTLHIRGFTMVEMLVSVGLFAILMVISVGALLMLLAANHKAQALQSVMNNFNISLDGMVRSIRQGSQFHCGEGIYTQAVDCPDGGATFAFEPYGDPMADPWVITFDEPNHRINESQDGGLTWTTITAPEVSISKLRFYLIGSVRGSDPGIGPTQPKVIIVIDGVAASNNTKARTTFHVQATAVQRLLDL
jgi:prepilin-type N-terminal cleavage/methylation domain-containing protein